MLVLAAAHAEAEVLVRWTEDRLPPPQALGVPAVVLPAGSRDTIRDAIAQGYRVYAEIESAKLATLTLPAGLAGVVVRGNATKAQLSQLRLRLRPPSARVLVLDERGKWPHIRSNWVTRNNEVLQVAGRSAQPWLENNAALIRIANRAPSPQSRLLTYAWTPATVSEMDEGPALEDYLVAIAEAGSFGDDLLLPLHERFQRNLVMGIPQARREWTEIRSYLEFYADNLPKRYRAVTSIGVVTDAPMVWFETMNLLARHNLPFELIDPSRLASGVGAHIKPLIVLGDPDAAQAKALAEFERQGGIVKTAKEMADPNGFALEMRRALGPDKRVVDIWNGITVLVAPYEEPGGSTMLLTALNYAHQPLPVQLRVPGTFSEVSYESPEEGLALLPFEHRDGHTEFVLPALRVGARVFLARRP